MTVIRRESIHSSHQPCGFEGSRGDYWEGGQREEVGSIAFRWVGWCGSFQAAAAALAA